jgi:hypothetical protein
MASPYHEAFKENSLITKPLACFPSWPSGVESMRKSQHRSLKKKYCHGNYFQAENLEQLFTAAVITVWKPNMCRSLLEATQRAALWDLFILGNIVKKNIN